MNVAMSELRKSQVDGVVRTDFEQVLDALGQALAVVDARGRVVYANGASLTLLGWTAGVDVGARFPQLLPVLAGDVATRTNMLLSGLGETYKATVSPLPNGQLIIEVSLASDTRPAISPVSTDELTGLATRTSLLQRLESEQADEALPSSIAVHCLDLDRFKMVNDTLGHGIGDLLLQKVSDRLRAVCSKHDFIARLGGDEFVVLQQNVEDQAAAENLASRIVDLIGRTYVLNGHTINIGVSVGVCLWQGPDQARDLLRYGDLALYEAKKAGRGRFRLFEIGMDAALLARRDMEIDLRRALALKQFKLNYQPFVDVSTNSVDGFEALLRWEHPVKGNIPPLSFIPLAEENGMIVKIGEWVLKAACMEAVSWPNDMIVAVNVSPLQFKTDTLLETVSLALARSGLPAHRLEIEITEGALLDDTDNVLKTLEALGALGVKISMDDFGTGYSSLSYLQKFPFNKIKIDRSFVANNNADSGAILRSIAGLGISLGMAITAEGVETAEQFARIRGERCTHVQGYFTGRPMGTDQIPAFLAGCSSQPGGTEL